MTSFENNESSRPCQLCQNRFAAQALRAGISVRPGVTTLIEKDYPDWHDGHYIRRDDLAIYRRKYIEQLLAKERGPLGELDHQVLDGLATGEMVTQNPGTYKLKTQHSVIAWQTEWQYLEVPGHLYYHFVRCSSLGCY